MSSEPKESASSIDEWRDEIRKTAKLISATDKVAALTGAGISVDSGIPDFRGADGLWSKYDPMEYSHIDAFLSNPEKVWSVLLEAGQNVMNAKPNPAHHGLAELERMGHLKAVVTQNTDNLHQRAGSRNVIEFHGNGQRLVCLTCGEKYEVAEMDFSEVPPRCKCSGLLKPDVVFFGEQIPVDANLRADEAARTCAVMMVIGTSAVVWPAANIPRQAKIHGAKVVEINPERTDLTLMVTDHYIGAPAAPVLTALVEEVKTIRQQSS